MEEVQNEFDQENEGVEDEEYESKKKDQYEIELIKSSIKGDYDKVKYCLDKKANINYVDRKKWTAFVWASCNGHIEILKLLIERGGAVQYIEKQEEVKKDMMRGNIDYNLRPSPLIWACFKGNYKIVWHLLKLGLDWEEIDGFGNNSMHQAAAGDNLEVVKILLLWGARGGIKNTRGHEAKELATNQEIIILLDTQEKMLMKNPQQVHWCSNCKQFFVKENYDLQWVYESDSATTMDKIDGKCKGCRKMLQMNEEELRTKMKEYNEVNLKEKIFWLEESGLEIDIKLIYSAKKLLEKLETQNKIMEYILTLKRVDNYKTILRSVGILDEMIEDSVKRGIDLDGNVKDKVKSERDRLMCERNLRFQLDNLDPNVVIIEDVKNLEELIQMSQDNNVDQDYLLTACALRDKLNKNIKANEIFKLFNEYMVRDYPPIPMLIDPKSKKPIDPKTKKPIDPKLIPPPPKKNKKAPKFVIPEWATEVHQLEEKIKEINSYIAEKDNINLSIDKINEAKPDLDRMNQELKFRKLQDEQAALDLEFKKANTKKK